MNEVINNLFSASKLASYIELGTSLAFILIIAVIAWISVSMVMKKMKAKTKNHQAQTVLSLIESVIKYALFFIILITILQSLGINTAALITGAGILGFALSFGSQKIVQDLVAGLFIVFEDQFDIGDEVVISGITGIIEKIELRTTTIKSPDGALHIIPNGSIDKVTNLSRK